MSISSQITSKMFHTHLEFSLVVFLQEEESPLPDEPSLVVQPSAGFTLSAVPLSSLLEPRISQSRDSFEVCVSASARKNTPTLVIFVFSYK